MRRCIVRRLKPQRHLSHPLQPGYRRRHCLRQFSHGTFSPPRKPRRLPSTKPVIEASYSSYAVLAVIAFSSAIAFDYYTQSSTPKEVSSPPVAVPLDEYSDENHEDEDKDNHVPDYFNMPTPQGHLGNLTPEQEQKLRDFWALALKTFGVQDQDPSRPRANSLRPRTAETTPVASDVESNKTPKKHSKRLSLFGRKHDDADASTTASPPRNSTDDDDKYGQTAQLRQILASQTPESLRAAFWSMVKSDHPDALLLRFLRARKWDIDRALAMLVSTMSWRSQEMHVDDDVMLNGEGGAKIDEISGGTSAKKEGQDFLTQLRMGKSFLHGTDREGRPLTYVRARLHKGGEQTEKSLERYTVYTIETARLALHPPVETACIVFDMTGFTMANMDYAPVKFMIKVFEANYPESLGSVLVHKAPWIFQGIWKIIKGWLDPVVAAKVSFTNSVEDMEAFIPKSQIIKELGGHVDWEYKYIEPVAGENDLMKDTVTRDKILEARKSDVLTYQRMTFDWIAAGPNQQLKSERDALAKRLNENYWQLDPYIRARSVYDRVGFLGKGGKIDFFPNNELKTMNVNGSGNGPPRQDVHADDLD